MLSWLQILVENLSWDEQKQFLELTLLDPLIKRFPIKVSYQARFLQNIINIIEMNSGEVHDEIYEHFCTLKNSTTEDDFTYKHFLLPDNIRIIIKEAKSIISSGTTGLRTWEAANCLVDFFASNNQSFINGKHILELGSGTGFTGIFLHKLLSPMYIYLTDCHDAVLQLLEENLNMNECIRSKIDSGRLYWGRENFNIDFIPDVILASDVVYDNSLFQPFIETIETVFKLNSKCVMFLACTIRNEITLEQFLQLANKKFCIVDAKYSEIGSCSYFIENKENVKIFIITK